MLSDLSSSTTVERPRYSPGAGRGRLFDGVCGVLDRMADHAPVVLVLEDLHWADPATLDLLAYLLRGLRRQRLLVVGSYRGDDPGDRLPGWLAETRRSRLVDWVDVVPFTMEELAAHLAALHGDALADPTLLQIFARSQGNPFYAEELFAAGCTENDARLPAPLREVLHARIGRLSDLAQRVLEAVAVAGGWARQDVVTALAVTAHPQATDAKVSDALREALADGVLELVDVEGDRRGVFAFRHALLREAVYDALLPGERARLHEACARALTRLLAESSVTGTQIEAELADHWYRADRPVEALQRSARAAEHRGGRVRTRAGGPAV